MNDLSRTFTPITTKPDKSAEGYLLVILGQPEPNEIGFELSSARLSLGAGENDDVYVSDVGVVPGHVEMIFLDGRVTVLSAAETVYIDGQLLKKFPFDWLPLSTLSLGPDTHLAYGAKGANWPVAPEWNAATDMAGEGLTTSENDDFPNDTLDPVDDHAGEFHLPFLSPRARAIHSARMTAWALAAATVIVIVFVASDLLWGSREVVHPSALAIDKSELALTRLLKADPANYGSVKLTERPDGALALTGFIESEESYRQLAEQVRQEDFNSRGNVRLDAMTSSRLLALVEDQLTGYPLTSRIDVSAEEVRLTVVGIVIDTEKMQRIRARLSRLASRVAPRDFAIDFQLVSPEQITAEIEAELSLGPITRGLRFSVEDDGGHIRGLVAASVEEETRSAVLEIKNNFADRLRLYVDLQVDEKVNFNVVSLSQGGQASLVTMAQYGNTQTFLAGEAVYGVAKLLEIKADGVALLLGRREIFLPLVQ
jgi:hypothetical protein